MDRSRRLVLGALPAAALLAACTTKPGDTAKQAPPSAPDPTTPEDAIAVLMDGKDVSEGHVNQASGGANAQILLPTGSRR